MNLMIRCPLGHLVTSPERRLKWATCIVIMHRPLSRMLSSAVNFPHFQLLIQNDWWISTKLAGDVVLMIPHKSYCFWSYPLRDGSRYGQDMPPFPLINFFFTLAAQNDKLNAWEWPKGWEKKCCFWFNILIEFVCVAQYWQDSWCVFIFS